MLKNWVLSILDNQRSLEHVRPLVSDDFTYVSLNYEDADLKKNYALVRYQSGRRAARQDLRGRRKVLARRQLLD
jgi:hypothetical protein